MSRTLSTFTGPNRTGEKQINFLDPVGRRLLRVERVEQITPKYRRIVLTGHDLADGFPFANFAPADHVKLFFPQPDSDDIVMPTITEKGWELPDDSPAPIYRDYTVRAYDEERRELTIDFVVHEHGVAGLWARDAQPGQVLGVLGPRGNVLFPENFARYIAAGDETALPAISRLIEEAPEGSRVTAVIEIADAGEQQRIDLPAGANAEIIWVPRDSSPVGDGCLSALETALRDVHIGVDDHAYVFVAGEAGALAPIRRYLRRDLFLLKHQLVVDGYWRRGTVNFDHHSQPDSTSA